MKRKNPPAKSPLMKVINESMGKGGAGNELEGDEGLMLDGIGCTANVILIDYGKKKLYVANAGDSRCVMGHGGKCTALSFDHKPECQVEIDRIYKAGSVITEGRVDGNLNLTRALGDLRHKQKDLPAEEQPITANPDVFEYDLPEDLDFILMGCDGVWEQKSNEEMVEWVYKRCNSKMANTDLTEVVSDLLRKECLSPDHTQTGKFFYLSLTAICRRNWLRQHDLHSDRIQQVRALQPTNGQLATALKWEIFLKSSAVQDKVMQYNAMKYCVFS
jgi:hypothetical protein